MRQKKKKRAEKMIPDLGPLIGCARDVILIAVYVSRVRIRVRGC